MRISQDAVAAAEQSDDDLCIYILNEHLARMLMVRSKCTRMLTYAYDLCVYILNEHLARMLMVRMLLTKPLCC